MLEILDTVAHTMAGWRFVFSSAYRERTRARWRDQPQMHVMQDVVGAVGGMLVSILLPLFVWWSMKGS